MRRVLILVPLGLICLVLYFLDKKPATYNSIPKPSAATSFSADSNLQLESKKNLKQKNVKKPATYNSIPKPTAATSFSADLKLQLESKKNFKQQNVKNDEHDEWCYRPPFNKTLKGKEFKISKELWEAIKLDNFIQSSDVKASDIVFVNAASSNHLKETAGALASVQEWFPQNKVIFYDIEYPHGMGKEADVIRTACNVAYRIFDFNKWPPHVKRLTTYAFKLLIIQEVLKEHSAIFWMDASITWHSNNLQPSLEIADKLNGLYMPLPTTFSNYAMTNPRMYSYIPTNVEQQKQKAAQQIGATGFFIYRTEEIWDNIFKWSLLCALTEDCISPKSQRGCNLGNIGNPTAYSGCHRFDQSLLNTLSSNFHQFDWPKFVVKQPKNIIDIQRHPRGNNLKKCMQ